MLIISCYLQQSQIIVCNQLHMYTTTLGKKVHKHQQNLLVDYGCFTKNMFGTL